MVDPAGEEARAEAQGEIDREREARIAAEQRAEAAESRPPELPEELLPSVRVLILEGSYCNLPEIRKYADVRLFLDAPWEVRKARLLERESPDSMRQFLNRWIPLENAYFAAFHLPDEGCVMIDGGDTVF